MSFNFPNSTFSYPKPNMIKVLDKICGIFILILTPLAFFCLIYRNLFLHKPLLVIFIVYLIFYSILGGLVLYFLLWKANQTKKGKSIINKLFNNDLGKPSLKKLFFILSVWAIVVIFLSQIYIFYFNRK